jgi:hypothetical protein
MACLAVVIAIWADLRPPPTTPHPFAVVDLSAGDMVEPEVVEMRAVPAGLLQPVALPAVLARGVSAGEPVTAGVIGTGSRVPGGWLTLDLPIPAGTGAGAEVVAVITGEDEPVVVPGVVVSTGTDEFGGAPIGACAFPSDQAPLVAAAAADGSVTVLAATG